MNRITITVDDPQLAWLEDVRQYLGATLDYLNRDRWDLSVVFCDDAYIHELNRRFRQKDEATDVLSFPLGDMVDEDGDHWYLPGDIVVSLDMVRANAAYFAVDYHEELRRVLVHGILHLDGMDHATNAADEPMLLLQERILQMFAQHGQGVDNDRYTSRSDDN
jgi:probable rRNA maturation factor